MEERAQRFGICVVLCALVARLFATGIPARLITRLQNPQFLAFLTYLETGQAVRFSPSLGVFSPEFVESPPARATEPTLPDYGLEEEPEIYYACPKEPDIQALLEEPLQWNLCGTEPTVLILHTHATESYTKRGEGYVETAMYRTLDEGYNMLSLGAYVAEALTAAGIPAVQDRTLHDYPSYNGSYVHARQTLKALLEEYPTVQLVLDIHRDAVEVSYGQLHTRWDSGEETAAQLMLVHGTNYDTWEENLSLGLKLQAQLERQAPGITRPLQLRAQRFNQDLCPGMLLVEIGAAGNTHPEAMAAASQLVTAIQSLAKGTAPK